MPLLRTQEPEGGWRGKLFFLAPMSEKAEAAFAAALPGAYLLRSGQGGGEAGRQPARVRQATVGEALKHWEEYNSFSGGSLGEAGRAELMRCAPGEPLPHVWVVEPQLPQQPGEEGVKLMLPGLGGWDDEAAALRDLQVVEFARPLYHRYFKTAQSAPGRYVLVLHASQPMEAAGVEAALQQSAWYALSSTETEGLRQLNARQQMQRRDAGCWEGTVPFAQGNIPLRLSFDAEASASSLCESLLPDGRRVRGYRYLVFHAETVADAPALSLLSSLHVPSVYGQEVRTEVDGTAGRQLFSATLSAEVAVGASSALTPYGAEPPASRPEPAVSPSGDLALLQLPDKHDYIAYAYRLSNSAPLKAAQLQLLSEGGQVLATHPVVDGLVQGELPPGAHRARLICGEESHTAEVSWKGHLPKPHPQLPDATSQWARAFALTDRRAYRPGDVVRICGFVREFREGQLHFPQGFGAELRYELPGPDGVMQTHHKPIDIAPDGSYMTEFRLADDMRGVKHMLAHVRLVGRSSGTCVGVPIQENPVPALQMEGGFSLQGRELRTHAALRTMDGAPLDGRGLRWEFAIKAQNPAPRGCEQYCFGDWRPDAPLDEAFAARRDSIWQYSRGSLDAQGCTEAVFSLPEMPFPRRLALELVADSGYSYTPNGMRHKERLTLEPAELCVGLRRERCLTAVGSRLPLSLLLAESRGGAYTGEPVEVELTATLRPFVPGRFGTGQRVAPAGEVVFRRQLMLPARGATLSLPLEKPGAYDIVVRGRDAAGKEFASAIRQYAWSGGAAAPWVQGYEAELKLTPDKTLYRVGETAQVLLGGELEGRAVVLIEGTDSRRFLQFSVKAGSRRLSIPLLEEDGPAPELRVALVQGTSLRPRDGRPAVQQGKCQLAVEPDDNHRLCVQLEELPDSLQAGERCEVRGSVRDAEGHPVPHSNVFVYAQDVGVTSRFTGLASAEFSVDSVVLGEFSRAFIGVRELPPPPSPIHFFRARRHGRPGAALASAARANTAQGTALWQQVQTDAEGQFCAHLTAPEGLADYQVVALACGKLPTQFGAAALPLHVDNPLSMRADMPDTAHVGDLLELPLHLRLASLPGGAPERTRWRVTAAGASGAECLLPTQEVELAAGELVTLRMPVRLLNAGKVHLCWRVEAVAGQAGIEGMVAEAAASVSVQSIGVAAGQATLRRVYERRREDGSWEAATNFRRGELVRISIEQEGRQIDAARMTLHDHLPTGWEPVLHEHSVGCTAAWVPGVIMECRQQSGWRFDWDVRHSGDCLSHVSALKGRARRLCYLARVTTCGELIAPPALLEGECGTIATSEATRVTVEPAP